MRSTAYFATSLLALGRAEESFTFLRSHSLLGRDVAAGGGCGPSAANAICATGMCCSASGICGTGTSFCNAPDCQLSYGPACDGNQIPPGQDTSKVPRPVIGSVPYGVSISHCTVNGKVALTFDDGPYLYTSELLDILKKNNVKATFFLVGNNGGKGQIEQASTGYPATVQRMYSEGHQIGSHSWSHQNMSSLTAQQRHDQIVRNEIALTDILGFFPTYFRPPYTQCPSDCLKDLGDLGYHVLNYDIDTRDWQGDYTYAQNTYNNILTQHSPGSSSWISLAHDIQPNTVHGFAQYMIDHAKSLGYELVTVGQCLGDPEANWYRNPTSGQAWTGNVVSASSSVAAASPSSTSSISSTSLLTLVTLVAATTAAQAGVVVSSAAIASISTPSASSTAPTTLAASATSTAAAIVASSTSSFTALPVQTTQVSSSSSRSSSSSSIITALQTLSAATTSLAFKTSSTMIECPAETETESATKSSSLTSATSTPSKVSTSNSGHIYTSTVSLVIGVFLLLLLY